MTSAAFGPKSAKIYRSLLDFTSFGQGKVETFVIVGGRRAVLVTRDRVRGGENCRTRVRGERKDVGVIRAGN